MGCLKCTFESEIKVLNISVQWTLTLRLTIQSAVHSLLIYDTNLIHLLLLLLLRNNCTLAEVVSTDKATVVQQINR